MAERRMFAKSIISSARFLRMPPSSRLLYYDLGMQADDDGVVEAFTVMRTTGATEDDLRILCSKGFVAVLNEDLVSYIKDWKTNNFIRNDRYRPTIYQELLVKMNCDNQRYTDGIPSGNQMDTQDRIDKDRTETGEDREDEDRDNASSPSSSASEVITYLAKYGVEGLSQSAIEELEGYLSEMGMEVCLKAVDAAVDAGMVGWGYVRGVLIKKKAQGVRSIDDWERVEARRDQEKKYATEGKGNIFMQIAREEGIVPDKESAFHGWRAKSALDDCE